MTKEDDGCRLFSCKTENAADTVFCTVEITVSEDYAVSLKVYGIGLDRVAAFEDTINIAVACYGEPGARAIDRSNRVGIVEAVAEEEYNLGIGIAQKSLAHITAVAVGIRKYNTFHNKSPAAMYGYSIPGVTLCRDGI